MIETQQRELTLTMDAESQSLELSPQSNKAIINAVEALNTFRGPQGPEGPPGSIENLTIDDVPGLRTELDNKQPKGAYLTAETDPTVPAWAKAAEKPTYTANEVGALPVDGTAANAALLNGKNAGEYVLHEDALSLEEIQASTNFDGKVASASAAYELGRKGTKRGFEGAAQAVPIETWAKTSARVFLEKGEWLLICHFFRDQGGQAEYFRVYLGVGTGETYDDDSRLGGFSGNWASTSLGVCDLWVPSDAYYNIFVKHEATEAHTIDIRGSFIRL